MKPRVLLEFTTASESDTTRIRDAMIADLAGEDVNRNAFAVEESGGRWMCNGDIIFNLELDATLWRGQVYTRWTVGGDALIVLAGDHIHQHRCPHPEAEEPYHCRYNVLSQFVEDIR